MRKEVLKEPTFEKEIAVMIRVSKSMDEMREQLRAYHDNDIAQSLKYLNRAERNLLYSGLDAKWLAEINGIIRLHLIDDLRQFVYADLLDIRCRIIHIGHDLCQPLGIQPAV
mgnify:CR=1 FL=1